MKCKYCLEDDERDRLGYRPKHNICECSMNEKMKTTFLTLLAFIILLPMLFLMILLFIPMHLIDWIEAKV